MSKQNEGLWREAMRDGLLNVVDAVFHPLESLVDAAGLLVFIGGVGGFIWVIGHIDNATSESLWFMTKTAVVGLGLMTVARIWRAGRAVEKMANLTEKKAEKE